MKMNWRYEIPQLLLIMGMFAAALAAWPYAPDRIPIHWNLAGEVDGYGGKFTGLLSMPLLASVAYLLCLVLPKIDPGRANYPSFDAAYFVIRLSALTMLVFVDTCILLVAFGHAIDMGRIMPIAVGLLFIVLGNVMGKIRPNWFVGIRTPWTLSSRRSWNQTHRLGGWLFFVMGVTIGMYGFKQTNWMIALMATDVIVSLVWIFVYSYLVWRDDPDRLNPTSISPATDEK
jgi:uncharacterized membrane protein